MSNKQSRIIALSFALLILLALFIWYGSISPDPSEGRYPGGDDIIEDREKYVGEKVEISGKVIETDPLTVEVESGQRTIQLEIVGAEKDIDKKDRISIFGRLEDDNTIAAENVVTYPFWNYIYMYAISILGASWLGLRIISHWRFDREEFRFESRKEPLAIKKILSGWSEGGKDG